MRIIEKILILSISLLILLTSCSTTTDPSQAYPGESATHIFYKGESALRSHNYREAIRRFEALDVQYPYGIETETAELHLIYAYYMSEEYVSCEATAERFIHAHPVNPHVDYAYYMRGLSSFYQNLGILEKIFAVDLATRDLTQIKKTYAGFAELTQRFPQSIYTPAAHQYMVYLRNLMASHELEVAEYYFSRGAYIAAANRANLVIRHYQGAPAVPRALVLMIKSYRALKMTKNADEALQVYQYNFPGSSYLKK